MFSTPRKKPIGLLQKISPLENTDTCIIILKHIRAPLSFSSFLSPLPYRLSLGQRSMDGLRANSADTTKSITCHNVCLVIFTDRTYSCMLCARATWPLSIFRSLSWSAWDDCRNWWNASDNFHCSWATLFVTQQKAVLTTEEDFKSQKWRQCGWTILWTVSFMQGCVTPLECVQH